MVKQNVTLTVENIANLILSLNEAYYCAVDSEDNESFCIMDYCVDKGAYTVGNKFKMTISKLYVDIFYFPTLNIRVALQNETEFQELISLYIDFRNKVQDFLFDSLKGIIKVKSNHKNPFGSYEEFLRQILDDQMNNAQRRREVIRDGLDIPNIEIVNDAR